jgi:parallel beta-helix repeat protein
MIDEMVVATRVLFFVLLVEGSVLAMPDTTQVSGNVSGVWDDSLSPYAVVGEVTVPAGETLVIRPGVEVRFRGPYHFTVNGVLVAVGTESDSIVFTRDSAIEGHKWKGIRFVDATGICSLAYCRVEYAKNDGAYPEVRGGAIYCLRSYAVISHCALCHNYSANANQNGAGGGICAEDCSPVIEYCHIFDNTADSGGGICALEPWLPYISNNVVEDNTALYSGGGMYLGPRSEAYVIGNIVRHNRCPGYWGGGGITLWNWYATNYESKTLLNNLVYGNVSNADGGGIYTRYDLSFIYNNTIVGNSASRGGGIYVLNEGQYLPDARNCIVYDNTASSGPSIYLDNANSSEISITWSDVEGGWSGTGNFDSVPNFVDTVMYRLGQPSRCIDAGTSDNAPPQDFEGQDRFDQPNVPNRGAGPYPYYDVGWDENTATGVVEGPKPQASSPGLRATVVRASALSRGTMLYDIAGKRVRGAVGPGVYFAPSAGRLRRVTVVK